MNLSIKYEIKKSQIFTNKLLLIKENSVIWQSHPNLCCQISDLCDFVIIRVRISQGYHCFIMKSGLNYQLSIIHFQLSIINYRLSIIIYQLSIINYHLSIINYQC